MLTLRVLDSSKIFTENNISVCGSSLSQPSAQTPVVPADLQLFYWSLSNPNTESRDFLNAEVCNNLEIKDAGDPVIQLLSLALPKA